MFSLTTPDVSTGVFTVRQGTSTCCALTQASSLLACAQATAYEVADRYSGSERHAGLSVVHLLAMAKALVDTALANEEEEEEEGSNHAMT